MSSLQILFAAAGAGGGPPPPAGPAFYPAGTGFGGSGPTTLPAFVPFAPFETVNFSNGGTLSVFGPSGVAFTAPAGWDASGGTYAGTTGVDFFISSLLMTPFVGTPMGQLSIAGTPAPGPGGPYILDPGGGGIGGGFNANFDMQFFPGINPGDVLGVQLTGTMSLVDVATRATVYSTASYGVTVVYQFI